jgi:hypothetical protein
MTITCTLFILNRTQSINSGLTVMIIWQSGAVTDPVSFVSLGTVSRQILNFQIFRYDRFNFLIKHRHSYNFYLYFFNHRRKFYYFIHTYENQSWTLTWACPYTDLPLIKRSFNSNPIVGPIESVFRAFSI